MQNVLKAKSLNLMKNFQPSKLATEQPESRLMPKAALLTPTAGMCSHASILSGVSTLEVACSLFFSLNRPVLGLQDQVAFVDGVLRIMCFGHAGAAMLADEASCIVSTAGDDDDNSEDEGSKQDPAAQNARENAQDNDAPTLLNALVNALSTTFLARVNEKLLQTSEAAASRVSHTLFLLMTTPA